MPAAFSLGSSGNLVRDFWAEIQLAAEKEDAIVFKVPEAAC